MYESFRFVLFNETFPNLAKFWPQPDISRICQKGRISAGAELLYSPSLYIGLYGPPAIGRIQQLATTQTTNRGHKTVETS